MKLAGQAGIARDVLRVPAAARMIDDLAAELNRCPELDDCRSTEGAAAVAYWQAADKPGRDSMALDLIEAVRPLCDRLMLSLLDVGLGVPLTDQGKPAYLDRRWLTETREGECRLIAPLTHRLASFAADIGAAVRPHAEHVARLLAGSAPGRVDIPKAKKTARKPVPPSSYKPARLREGASLADVVPDELWHRVRGYLPEPPASPYGHRRTGKPRDTTLGREAVAVAICTELLRVPYASLGACISATTARVRLREWQWSRVNGSTAWEHIAAEAQGHGHLSGLTA